MSIGSYSGEKVDGRRNVKIVLEFCFPSSAFCNAICGLFRHWNSIMHGDALEKPVKESGREMCEGRLWCSVDVTTS